VKKQKRNGDVAAKVLAVVVFAVFLAIWVAGMRGLAELRGGAHPHSDNVCTAEYVQAHPSECPEDPISSPGLP
jgi:hypothetical protein